MAQKTSQESDMNRLPFAFALIILVVAGSVAAGQSDSDGQEKVLNDFPSHSQGDTSWCAWVSAQMVLSYYGYSYSPEEIAVETFKLAGQTWSGSDNEGLPWRYYKSYEEAIQSLSNNGLTVDEISTDDKDEILFKIFAAIDYGYPIILLSGGPWLYDATDFPDSSWIELSPETSWPSGNHASVIVGYSLKEEMNNFFSFGPLTFLTNLLDYPPVIKIHDPATAANGVGIYWVSYSKLFDKTIGYPSVTRLLTVKPSSEANVVYGTDGNPPIVDEFRVTSLTTISGKSFEIDYTVSDNGGSGLKQVELWRKNETSNWQEIKRNSLTGENGPISGSFTDSPPAPGTYWYGVHVVDNAGNWNDEKNSNTNYQPESFEPIEVGVIDSASAQGSTNCDSAEAKSWFERGVAFYDQFDYTEAIDCFDEATKICPQYEEAWGKMGDAYLIGRFGFFSDNNPNEAIRCYDEALKINPRNETVWNNKGTAYNDLGQYDEAIQCYDEALIINPEYGGAWYGKGHSQYNQGNYGDALQSIEMAITFNPEIPPFWQEKGVILEALGYEGAQAAFDKADELKKIHKPIRKTEGAVEYD